MYVFRIGRFQHQIQIRRMLADRVHVIVVDQRNPEIRRAFANFREQLAQLLALRGESPFSDTLQLVEHLQVETARISRNFAFAACFAMVRFGPGSIATSPLDSATNVSLRCFRARANHSAGIPSSRRCGIESLHSPVAEMSSIACRSSLPQVIAVYPNWMPWAAFAAKAGMRGPAPKPP